MSGCGAFRQGDDREAFAAHVASCASCQASLSLEPAPADLRARVEGLFAAKHRRPLPKLAACAATLLLLLASVSRRDAPPLAPPASALAALAAGSHVRFVRTELSLDVRSERAGEICAFFARRVPFPLELQDAPPGLATKDAYQLTGARQVSFRGEPAVFVAYRVAERPVSLVVTSARAVPPAVGEAVTSGALRFHLERVQGLRVITWTDNGLAYALASDAELPAAQSCTVCHAAPRDADKLLPLRRTRS